MLSINQKVSRPYIAMLVALPLLILVIFNIIVTYYATQQAEEDLQAASSQVGKHNFSSLNDLVRIADLTDTTEIVVYDKNGGIAQLSIKDVTFMNTDIADLAYDKIDQADSGEIVSFKVDGVNYYAIEVEAHLPSNFGRVIYISFGHFEEGFVSAVNMILLVITLVITAIFLVISRKVVKGITKPIETITNQLATFNGEDLILLSENQNSLELLALTHELNTMSTRIYNYNKQQKSFLHNASHELRTPLMSIQGYAEGIQHGIFQDSPEIAAIIVKETMRLTSLVDELLTLSRMENYDTTKLLTPHHLSDIIQEHIQQIRGYATNQGKVIHLDIQEELTVIVNDALMTNAFGNIMSNCIKYAKSRVDVTVTLLRDTAIIRIADDGDGVCDQDLPYIFDKFYKGKDGNFGLGLPIAKTAVERMNGEIIVSNGDTGAVFELHLPIAHNF